MPEILPPVPFWFLRHGETDYNARGLSQGAIDVDLNAIGRDQAKAAGLILKDHDCTAIFCSPMRRTRETAALANEVLGLPITYDADLREAVFGGKEGQPLAPWFFDWVEGRVAFEGTESFAELTVRVSRGIARAVAHPGPVLIVAHGGVFRAVRQLMALPPDQGLTPNGMPLFCAPADGGWGAPWAITPARPE